MHGTQELAATVAISFLRVTLVPIIDLDVIQFAAETVTAATSAPAPDPCRSLTPTRRRKTSAPHPSAGGHLRELTICAGTSTWTPVGIVSNRFCAAANAAADSRVATLVAPALLGGACVGRCRRLPTDHSLAFCMVSHSRLGAQSTFACLLPELVRGVVEHAHVLLPGARDDGLQRLLGGGLLR